MLEFDASVKGSPERWQERKHVFDIVFTVEMRIFDAVLEGLS